MPPIRRDADIEIMTPLGLLKVFEIVVGLVCLGLMLTTLFINKDMVFGKMTPEMRATQLFFLSVVIVFLTHSLLSLISNMIFRATNEIIYNLVAAFLFFAAFIILAVDISDMSGLDHTLQAIAVAFGALNFVLYGVGAFLSCQEM